MFMWLGLIVLFFGAFFWIRETDNRYRSDTGTNEESSLEILKKNYAKGGINREEFLEKKKDLMS